MQFLGRRTARSAGCGIRRVEPAQYPPPPSWYTNGFLRLVAVGGLGIVVDGDVVGVQPQVLNYLEMWQRFLNAMREKRATMTLLVRSMRAAAAAGEWAGGRARVREWGRRKRIDVKGRIVGDDLVLVLVLNKWSARVCLLSVTKFLLEGMM